MKILIPEIACSSVNYKKYCLAGIKSRIKEKKSREMNKVHPLRMHPENKYFCHPIGKVIRKLLGKPAQNNCSNSSGTNNVHSIPNIFLKIINKKTPGFQNTKKAWGLIGLQVDIIGLVTTPSEQYHSFYQHGSCSETGNQIQFIPRYHFWAKFYYNCCLWEFLFRERAKMNKRNIFQMYGIGKK